MPFRAQAHLAALPAYQRERLLADTITLGFHPTTRDVFLVSTLDRYSSMYLLGLPGMGKSSLLVNTIFADALNEHAVIVIDPHGDVVRDCVAQLPDYVQDRIFILDMEDESHPFGLNVFNVRGLHTAVAYAQAVDRVCHVFHVLWPDVLGQAHMPIFLRAATILLFANPGATLVDMQRLLEDEDFRYQLLRNVSDQSVLQFWAAFDELSDSARRQQVAPLVNRLRSIFMGRPLVRNILGQSESTVDFKQAIERKEIILIRLPLKLLAQDARLIGTLLIAKLHTTLFEFGNVPEAQRPGFTLVVDEFQNFATPDFAEVISEGRKFKIRAVLAHQQRSQLPAYLRDATMMARTKVCFQLTPEDAREMAHVFPPSPDAIVRPEDLDPHPVEYLLKYPFHHE